MPLELVTVAHDGQVEGAEGVAVAVEGSPVEDGGDELEQPVPLVEPAQRRRPGDDVVAHGGHGVGREPQTGMVGGETEIGDLQVRRSETTGMMRPGSERGGVPDQDADPGGPDETRELGGPGGRQLGPGLGDDRSSRGPRKVGEGVAAEVDEIEEPGVAVHGSAPSAWGPELFGASRVGAVGRPTNITVPAGLVSFW